MDTVFGSRIRNSNGSGEGGMKYLFLSVLIMACVMVVSGCAAKIERVLIPYTHSAEYTELDGRMTKIEDNHARILAECEWVGE